MKRGDLLAAERDFANPLYFGMRLVENANLLVDGKPYQRRRGWRERLLTRPWRPLQATETIIPKVPSPNFYMIGKTTVVAHPDTLARLKAALLNG